MNKFIYRIIEILLLPILIHSSIIILLIILDGLINIIDILTGKMDLFFFIFETIFLTIYYLYILLILKFFREKKKWIIELLIYINLIYGIIIIYGILDVLRLDINKYLYSILWVIPLSCIISFFLLILFKKNLLQYPNIKQDKK